MNIALKTKILKSNRPQIFLARKIGIQESSLSKIVNGWIDPKPNLKEKIALALNAPVAELFPSGEMIKDGRLGQN